jgi:predicted RNA-binding protein with PUA-like domain
MTSYWLLKTEPDDYSWTDLVNEEEAVWDGVKAPSAMKNIKQMNAGDLAFIYHTGKERAIIGIARVNNPPYLDSESHEWRFTVSAVNKLPVPVTLKQIKESHRFPDWDLVRLPRLSVVPVSQEQWETIMEWSQTKGRSFCW